MNNDMDNIYRGQAANEKIKTLKKVKTDSINWKIYYHDEANDEYWLFESLNPEYHGSGIPILKKIDKIPED
jgi:hypothetical protein